MTSWDDLGRIEWAFKSYKVYIYVYMYTFMSVYIMFMYTYIYIYIYIYMVMPTQRARGEASESICPARVIGTAKEKALVCMEW